MIPVFTNSGKSGLWMPRFCCPSAHHCLRLDSSLLFPASARISHLWTMLSLHPPIKGVRPACIAILMIHGVAIHERISTATCPLPPRAVVFGNLFHDTSISSDNQRHSLCIRTIEEVRIYGEERNREWTEANLHCATEWN